MFKHNELIAEVRKNDRGSHFLLEAVKYLFVTFTITYFANWAYSFIVKHDIKPFANIPGLWNFSMILLAVGAVFYCMVWEKLTLRQMGILTCDGKKTVRDYFQGLACGFLIIALIAGLVFAVGGLEFSNNLSKVKWLSFALILVSYLFQGLGEEVLFRGAFLASTVRKNPPIASILVTSVFFSLWHYKTDSYGVLPFINLFLFGVFCSTCVFAFRNVWIAGAFHAVWNFAQAHVFGVSVSGSTPDADSTLLIATVKGNAVLSGGDYGLEGSLLTSFVLLLAILAVLLYDKKRTKNDGEFADTQKE